jgi:hypothetical protein
VANCLTLAQVAGIAAVGTPEGTTVAEWVEKARQEAGSRGCPAGRINADATSGIATGVWQVNVSANRDLIPETAVSIANGHAVMRSPLRNWEVTKMIFERQGWQAWRASGGKPTPSDAARRAAGDRDTSVTDSGGSVDGAPEEGVEAQSVLDILTSTPRAIAALAGYLKDAVEVLVAAGKWIADPGNWARVALVGAGGAGMIIGLRVVAQPVIAPIEQKITGAATAVATKGASTAKAAGGR